MTFEPLQGFESQDGVQLVLGFNHANRTYYVEEVLKGGERKLVACDKENVKDACELLTLAKQIYKAQGHVFEIKFFTIN